MNTPQNIQKRLHAATQMGHVHYTVANLEKQVRFYQDILGFKLHWQKDQSAGLGAGKDDLLRLTENPAAKRYRGTTGLYHTAFLLPSRLDLAHLIQHIAETRTRIQGTSNHGTHLALYLPDAEGNGIELAWDFPEEVWPRTTREMMENNHGMDVQKLLQEMIESGSEWNGLTPETKVGHVHLHVADIPKARHFYHEVLGFDVSFDFKDAPPQVAETALFISAGGYHHHIGLNVWQGVGAPTPPEGALGLRYFTVVLPNEEERQRVRLWAEEAGISTQTTSDGVLLHDPSKNGVLLA